VVRQAPTTRRRATRVRPRKPRDLHRRPSGRLRQPLSEGASLATRYQDAVLGTPKRQENP